MKFRVLVEYEYPIEHKLPVKAELILHGDRVVTDNIKWIEQEPLIFKWCTGCREYDQEKHCCHRWSKVIRDTVEEMKQEYIEREVLDKIRAEIGEVYEELDGYDPDSLGTFACRIDDIIDKYKAESENT